MNDLLTQPYIEIKRGDKKLYKFKNGQKIYSEEEFKAILKQNIEDTCEVKSEFKQETKSVDKGNKKTKSKSN